MHVSHMSIDNTEVDSPRWEAIEAALDSLDGENVSELFLSGDSEFPWLSIAGGKDEYVTVQFARGPTQLFTLRDAQHTSGQITMVFAGQRAFTRSPRMRDGVLSTTGRSTIFCPGRCRQPSRLGPGMSATPAGG